MALVASVQDKYMEVRVAVGAITSSVSIYTGSVAREAADRTWQMWVADAQIAMGGLIAVLTVANLVVGLMSSYLAVVEKLKKRKKP